MVEEQRDIVRENVGCTGVTRPAFTASWCNSQGGEVVGLHRRSKKGVVNMILCVTRLLVWCALYVMGIWQQYLKWIPRLLCSLSKLMVRRQNPSMGQSHPEEPKWGTKRHKGWPTFLHTRCPIKGTRHPQASYLSLDYEVSFTPLCGLVSSHLGFLHGIPGKEAWNHLVRIWLREHYPLSDPMERHVPWLARTPERWNKLHSDPDSTFWCLVSDRSLAHKLGDHAFYKVVVQPLQVSETPEDGVGVNSTPQF
jgi:hypothetical protein